MDVVKSEIVQKYRVFSVERMVVREDAAEREYHVIRRPDSVQVVALAEDGRVIMVEQQRQGTRADSLEFVAGLVDADETPAAAAARELAEETGYLPGTLQELGRYHTDPAILTNRVTVYLAEDCKPGAAVQPDEGEQVRTRLFEPAEIPRMIDDGTITHGLVVSAWYLYQRRVQRSRSRT
jgi:8-oxo-dGTP pyrophosphatase MutT (NUDIX family)